MKDIQTRIDKARWWALTHQPFYGALAMRLPDVIDPSTETAHTCGREIVWNPTFAESLTDEELRFVLLHETLHCAHQHMWRLPPDERGNIAGDHEINLTLQAIRGIKMPEGGLADPQYAGMACEDILARLSKPEPPQPDSEPEPGEDEGESEPDQQDTDQSKSDQGDGGEDGDGQGDGDKDGKGDESPSGASDSPGEGQGKPSDPCGTFGAPAPGVGQDAAEAAQADKELREAWDGAVIQAALAAQALGEGDLPADLQRVLDRIRHQSIDWKREMADFVKDAMSTRNDWSRSSRRMATAPVIYPRKRIDDVGTVIFARDTSGSIDDKACAAFSAMVTECISETGCTGVVIDCDATIQAEYELAPWDECPSTAKGGGGTDFRPVFARADELVEAGHRVAGIVYLTDLDASRGKFPDSTDLATLWLATSDRKPPFGRAVRVEEP